MLGIASMLGAGAVVVGATAASAHVGVASATCEALTVNLTNFKPIVAAQPEEGYTEYEWSKTTTETVEATSPPGAGWTATAWEYEQRNSSPVNKWQDSPTWNAEGNPKSNGWTLTGKVRYTKTSTETAWSKTSLGEGWVKTGESRYIKTKDAQPAKANHVTVTINGDTVANTDFGTSYNNNFTFTDKYQANDWSVSWTAYDDPAYNGSAAGTTTPCVQAGPPDTPDTDKIAVCHSTGNGGYVFINPSKNSFYDGHRLEHDDIYPAGSILKKGQTLSWDAQGDQSLLATDCVAPAPTEIAVPAAPSVTDLCGRDNATWVVPADGGHITWTLEQNGDLVATADNGYTFPGGNASHNFGEAPETNLAPCIAELAVPATPAVTDLCGPGNATWVVPADGGHITWALERNGDLVATADNGYTFPGGKASHNFGKAPETNTTACPVVLASVAVAAPVLTPPTCTAPGKLSYTDHLGYTWNRTDDHGNVVLTATAKPGFTLVGQTSWSYTAAQLAQLSGKQACPPAVIPPKVEGVKHTAPPKPPAVKGVKHEAAARLPRTGSEAGLYGAAGLLLLMGGSGLVLVTRRRSIED